jgi:Pentapeptide repeats (9 copies)
MFTFKGAHFIGDARFDKGTRFTDLACFAGAAFDGDARFSHASFQRTAQFGGAAFNGNALFDRTFFDCFRLTQTERVSKRLAQAVDQMAQYDFLSPDDALTMLPVDPHGRDQARKSLAFEYTGATGKPYIREVRFDNATFAGVANFDLAAFERSDLPNFDGIRVLNPRAGHIWPSG